MRRLLLCLGLVTALACNSAARDRSTPSQSIAPLSAAAFTVRLVAATPPDTVEDPGLLALRDTAIRQLQSSLPAAWSEATRNLGRLDVVEERPGIEMKVVAASGTSVHRSSSRERDDIVIYVADQGRRLGDQELLATALHELGHIWCCRGGGTAEGHWTENADEGRQYGLNRYGLMNSPVRCKVLAGNEYLCPTRFSDRELYAFGFTNPPAATPDPCVAQADALRRQVDTAASRLASQNATLESIRGQAQTLASEIAQIEARNPRGIPSNEYARYSSLVDRYNALVAQQRTLVDTYNAEVDSRNVAVRDYNAVAARCVLD